jgi:hypothetical protein
MSTIIPPPNSVLNGTGIRRVNLDALPGLLVRDVQEDDSRRDFVKLFRKETAQQFIGTIQPGFHRWGFSKGQFSLIDVIEEVQRQLGTFESCSLSTWTIADADLSRLHAVLTAGRITGFRLLIDLSFQRRQPGLIAHLRKEFGDDAIRVTRNHAKFVLFRAGAFRVVCRTSMNLNLNPRLEDIELKDDAGMYDFLDGIVTDLFRAHEAKSQIAASTKDLAGQFQRLGGDDRLQADAGGALKGRHPGGDADAVPRKRRA